MQNLTFKNDYIITGAYPNQGSFKDKDTGELISYDHTKIYVQMPLRQGVGFTTVEYKFGSSDDFKRFENVSMPMNATIEFEQVTSGNGRVQTNILSVNLKQIKTS